MKRILFSMLSASAIGVLCLASGQGAQDQLKGSITLYTSEVQADVQVYIDAFKKLNSEADVKLFRSGTGEVTAKLDAEFQANNPQADLIWVADQSYLQKLSGQDRLARIAPTFSGVSATSAYEGGKYFEVRSLYNVIGVNTKKFPGKLPTGFTDLTRPEFKDVMAMPNPLFSGGALSTVGTLVQRYGWDYFERLKGNGLKIEQSNPITTGKLINGEYGVAILVDYSLRREKAKGAPLEIVYPREGAILVPTPIGVLKASKNQALAKAFLAFLYSAQGQQLFSDLSYVPVANAAVRPAGAPARINSMRSATGFISANRAEIGERFTKLFDLK